MITCSFTNIWVLGMHFFLFIIKILYSKLKFSIESNFDKLDSHTVIYFPLYIIYIEQKNNLGNLVPETITTI
jgi:hypothetical protein